MCVCVYVCVYVCVCTYPSLRAACDTKSIFNPAKKITDADYADDIVLLAIALAQAETLQHSLYEPMQASASMSMHTRRNIWGSLSKFPDFFVWALLLIVHTWNSRLQCTSFTVPKTSGRPHWSPLEWACQWPSSQPLSSPQLSHNDSFWA